MRGPRPGSGFARRAVAWLSFASLLALLAIQPFHAPEEAVSAPAARPGVHVAAPHAASHDTGTCEVCRAVSQVRAGLRGEVQQAAPQLALRPLSLSAVLRLHPAPVLRDAWPRGPPARRSA